MKSNRAKNIKFIAVHTTGDFDTPEEIQDYFLRPKNQGGRGWSRGGYNVITDLNGVSHKMYDYDLVTNGIRGYNSESLHLSYVGGYDKEKFKEACKKLKKMGLTQSMYNVRKHLNLNLSKDTRTFEQKFAMEAVIYDMLSFLYKNGNDLQDVTIQGHRDFSPDTNDNGIVDPWEYIKDCPCFNAKEEYKNVITNFLENEV